MIFACMNQGGKAYSSMFLLYTIRKSEFLKWSTGTGHFKSGNSTSKAMITRVVFLMQHGDFLAKAKRSEKG